MRNILILLGCLFLFKTATAQKDSLAFDEHGKYIYYKVVGMDKYSADTLYKRSLSFFKNYVDSKTLKLTEQDAKDGNLTGTGFLVVYKPSLAKHPDAQIGYQFKMEIKDGKYRYWLTDFVFKPYYRDRYNNYVTDNNIEVPLEKTSKNFSEKDRNHYLDEAALYAREMGDRLKVALARNPVTVIKKEPAKKVISIGKW
jgi:hypothetical protein